MLRLSQVKNDFTETKSSVIIRRQRHGFSKTDHPTNFIVFSAVAAASLSAGAIQNSLGWQAVNIGVLPLLAIILIGLLWGRRELLK